MQTSGAPFSIGGVRSKSRAQCERVTPSPRAVHSVEGTVSRGLPPRSFAAMAQLVDRVCIHDRNLKGFSRDNR